MPLKGPVNAYKVCPVMLPLWVLAGQIAFGRVEECSMLKRYKQVIGGTWCHVSLGLALG